MVLSALNPEYYILSEIEVPKEKEDESQSSELAFLIQSPDPLVWKTITKTLLKLVEQSTFSLDRDGVHLRTMNDSRNLLIELIWPAFEFTHFDCPNPAKFTVRLEDFAKVMGRAPDLESVRFSREGSGELKIQFGERKEFSMHLLEDGQSFPELKSNFDSKVIFKKESFNDALADIQAVSNIIQINVSSTNDIVFSGKGECGSSQRRFSSDDILDIQVDKPSEGIYSLDLLMAINPLASSISPTVEMGFKSNFPIRLNYPLTFTQDGKTPASLIRVYLAPRTR